MLQERIHCSHDGVVFLCGEKRFQQILIRCVITRRRLQVLEVHRLKIVLIEELPPTLGVLDEATPSFGLPHSEAVVVGFRPLEGFCKPAKFGFAKKSWLMTSPSNNPNSHAVGIANAHAIFGVALIRTTSSRPKSSAKPGLSYNAYGMIGRCVVCLFQIQSYGGVDS